MMAAIDVKELYKLEKAIDLIISTENWLLDLLEGAHTYPKDITALDIAHMNKFCNDYQVEASRASAMVDALMNSHLVEFQTVKIKMLQKKLEKVQRKFQQIFSLLGTVGESSLQIVEQGRKHMSRDAFLKLLDQFRIQCIDVKGNLVSSENSSVDEEIALLHCPKCTQPMAHVIFIRGNSIADMERTANKIMDSIKSYKLESWIVASPLEV